MKNTTIAGIMFCFFLVVSMPMSSTVMVNTDQDPVEDHPEYYEVIKYNMRGLSYDKETIRVSYEDAMAIKDAFEGIDSSLDDDKIERKANVLKSYGLIPRNIKSIQSEDFKQKYHHNDTSLIFASIEGFFGPSIINLINFLIFSPFFVAISFGINLKYTTPLFPGTFEFISNKPTQIAMMVFMGILIVFPFISPGGYIYGATFFGRVQELI